MSLVSEIMRYATPLLVDRVAAAVGINSSLARMAMTYALPAVLSAFTAKAASPAGAQALLGAVKNTDPNMLGSLESLLGGGGKDQFLKNGSSVLGSLLGQGGVSDITSALTKNAGIGGTAAAALLPIIGQMALGGIAKAAPNADASSLASMLSSQSDSFRAAMPKVSTPQTPVAAAPGGMGMLRWLLPLLALGALGWYFLGGQSTPVAPTAQQTTTAPAAGIVIDGVDVGKTVTDTMAGLGTTLGGITDVATATAALPKLQEATTAIEGLGAVATKMDATQKTALGGIISAGLPAVRAAADKALGIEGVGAIAKPVLDILFSKIEALAK